MNKSLISPYQVQQKGRKKHVKQIHTTFYCPYVAISFFRLELVLIYLETEGKFLRESAGRLPWCWREEPTCLDPAEDVKMGMAYRLICLFDDLDDWMISRLIDGWWFHDLMISWFLGYVFVFNLFLFLRTLRLCLLLRHLRSTTGLHLCCLHHQHGLLKSCRPRRWHNPCFLAGKFLDLYIIWFIQLTWNLKVFPSQKGETCRNHIFLGGAVPSLATKDRLKLVAWSQNSYVAGATGATSSNHQGDRGLIRDGYSGWTEFI